MTFATLERTVATADYVMPFGKYMGKSLDQISDIDPGYVVWLADENILHMPIESEFLDAVRRDEMDLDCERFDAFRDD